MALQPLKLMRSVLFSQLSVLKPRVQSWKSLQVSAAVPQNFRESVKKDEKSHLKFSDTPLSKSLVEKLNAFGFHYMSPLQKCVIPGILDGVDCFMCSETGSGKTLSYLIPILNAAHEGKLGEAPRSIPAAPSVVILTNSRGNGFMITRLLRWLKPPNIGVAYEFGGAELEESKIKLRRYCDILVSSPTRIHEQITAKNVSLKRCKFFAIDDIGSLKKKFFSTTVDNVMLHGFGGLPDTNNRQTFIAGIADPFGKNHFESYLNANALSINQDDKATPAAISQKLIETTGIPKSKSRLELLVEQLNRFDGQRGIIFCNQVHVVKGLESELHRRGFSTLPYHGDLDTYQRTTALFGFVSKKSQLLVSTPMGACVDFPSVNFVINYELPLDEAAYRQQIGRCGRMGKQGKVVTYCHKSEMSKLGILKPVLDFNKVPLPEFYKHDPTRKVLLPDRQKEQN